jgi:hypothetical protein
MVGVNASKMIVTTITMIAAEIVPFISIQHTPPFGIKLPCDSISAYRHNFGRNAPISSEKGIF